VNPKQNRYQENHIKIYQDKFAEKIKENLKAVKEKDT
jgi:hypothetical protein